jgi:hypothetical protein
VPGRRHVGPYNRLRGRRQDCPATATRPRHVRVRGASAAITLASSPPGRSGRGNRGGTATLAGIKTRSPAWRRRGTAIAKIHVNLVEAALRRVESDLRRHGYRWALIGGFAVSARAEPRFTRDVEVMVDGNAGAEALTRSLLADRYRLLASIEHDEAGRPATMRRARKISQISGHCERSPVPQT